MEKNLLLNGNIQKSYFMLTIPNVLSMVITLVYNLADTYFIAAVGNTDLVAGVSLCAPVLTVQMAFGNVFAQGGCSLVSRLLEREKKTRSNGSVPTVFIPAICWGLYWESSFY